MKKSSFHWAGILAGAGALIAGFAGAAIADGIPQPWQLNFQPPASPMKEKIEHMHDFLLIVTTVITVFVTALLGYVCWRFSAKRNPVPSKTTHNSLIEVIWTAIPVLILLVITVPSIQLLYEQEEIKDAEMTLKIVGHQWYWSYEYPDNGNFGFDSNMKEAKDLKPGELRLLEVDNRVVLPVDTNIRVQMTSTDVIHAWTIPAFGVKKDAMPGHLNETWFRATKTGLYYGQCSELCGVRHGFMPIVVVIVSKEEFATWVEEAKKKFASLPATQQFAVNQ